MTDEFEAGRGSQYLRTRPPILGRMSVFVIGLLIGAAIGAFIGVTSWDSVRPWIDPSAPAAAAATAATKATAGPAKAATAAKAVKALSGGNGIKTFSLTPQAINIGAGQKVVIGVFGDSMADGLWAGLYRELHDDKSYEIIRFSQSSTGLTNYQYVDVQQKTTVQLADKHIDIAVVLIGANDQQGILSGGAVYPFETDGWRTVYVQRMQALVALLRQHGAAVYWVGLPRMQRAEYDRRAGLLNEIYEEQSRALGISFIPTVQVTEDPDGSYDAYLKTSPNGRPQLMRAKDGIHMTMAGYLRLAGPVTSVIRAEVAAARPPPLPTPAPAPAAPEAGAVTLTAAPAAAGTSAR